MNAQMATPIITEAMIEAGIGALEEVAGFTYRRALAVEVYTAMEQARLPAHHPDEKGCSIAPNGLEASSSMQ